MVQRLTMHDVLSEQVVDASLDAATKKDVLEILASRASALLGDERLSVFDVLWERERLGTTGVGQGIAIPHGRVAGIEKVFGFFARLKQPVDFEAIDDKPVDLVFLLLSPEDAGADHLHALATVSRHLRDPALCAALRSAKDASSLYTLLTQETPAQAA